jgi:hypothetical protein
MKITSCEHSCHTTQSGVSIFFTTYVYFRFGDLIREKMPLCTKNPGGSLYIQREQRA